MATARDHGEQRPAADGEHHVIDGDARDLLADRLDFGEGEQDALDHLVRRDDAVEPRARDLRAHELDVAARKGVLHKNTVARKKSRPTSRA